MKNFIKTGISTSLFLLLLISCNGKPAQSQEGICKYDGCTNEVRGWDNYKTNSSYYGPKHLGAFQLKEYGGSFCSQEHAIKHLK